MYMCEKCNEISTPRVNALSPSETLVVLGSRFLTLKDVTNFEGHYRFRSIGRYVGEQGILPCICVILYNVGRESR